MSPASATTQSRKDDENQTRSILTTVLEQSESVEADTAEDLIAQAAAPEPGEFRRNFESKVSGLRGFRLREMVKGL